MLTKMLLEDNIDSQAARETTEEGNVVMGLDDLTLIVLN